MVTVDDYGAIRRAHRDGLSIRQIARQFGHSRQDRPACPRACRPPSRALDQEPGSSQARPLPGRSSTRSSSMTETAPPKQRHTAAQIYRRLRDEHDYRGGYAQVQRYLRKHRRRHKETFIPLGHLPGQRLEADFGHIHVDFPEGRKPVPFLVDDLGLLERAVRAGAAVRTHRGDPRRDGRRLRVLRRPSPRKSGGTTLGPSPR